MWRANPVEAKSWKSCLQAAGQCFESLPSKGPGILACCFSLLGSDRLVSFGSESADQRYMQCKQARAGTHMPGSKTEK